MKTEILGFPFFLFSRIEVIMSPNEFNTGVIKPIECMKEGYALIKDQYWLFFGITLVGMLIAGLIPFGIAIGAMFCGIYYCFFQKINGRPVKFEDLFKGFNYFIPGLLTSIIVIIPAFIGGILLYASLVGLFIASINSRGEINETVIWAMVGTMFVEGLIFAIVIGCLHALVMFAYPLIVERNMKGLDAFKLSARAAWENLGGVVGLITAEFILGLVAYLCTFFIFGLGAYFVMPIMFGGALVAYRKVFPPLNSSEIDSLPSSPGAF